MKGKTIFGESASNMWKKGKGRDSMDSISHSDLNRGEMKARRHGGGGRK